jgi:hypothetical protein
MNVARAAKVLVPNEWDLLRTALFFVGIPRNAFGSIDVTGSCNLRCRHCYFFEHEQPRRSLTVREWLDLLEHWKRTRSRLEFPFLQASWVGGEPLLRKELVEKGRRYFLQNLVVTNGTIPLPDWPDVEWFVSIDGDEEVHEAIRGQKGIYALIRRNVAAHAALRTYVSFCITRENAHCIERVVDDWADMVRGFTFDFYTPLQEGEDPLWVPWVERDRILRRLSALRRARPGKFPYGDRVLRLMRSDRARDVTSHCLYAARAFSYDVSGNPKPKCVMGPKADCSRCGCIVPFFLRALTDRRQIARDLLPDAVGRGRAALNALRSPTA